MARAILEFRKLAEDVENKHLKAGIRDAETTLLNYYRKACSSKPVVIATVCDPRFKLDYFNWAVKKNVSGDDKEIQRRAYEITVEVFREYHAKRGKGITRKVITFEEPS